jgi:formylglycine-generating enzyme required for sulfatase activity
MSGNVFEWCWNWYGTTYPSEAQTDPVGASSGSDRVHRGGSWDHPDHGVLRSVYRSANNPYNRDNGIGFRILRPAQ